jgi:hypothetical protein
MPICDGCGAHVDETHIRQRIERLELATRFRPIHIQVLLLDAAPPLEPKDYFYCPAMLRDDRSAPSRVFFDELATCLGLESRELFQEENILGEFQKRGFFLAYAIECPIKLGSDLESIVNERAVTVLLRVKSSYRPKFIAPISSVLQHLVRRFEREGWSDRLILNDGEPFDNPFGRNAQLRARIVAALSAHSQP